MGDPKESLRDSYRQSVREFRTILIIWSAFVIWNVVMGKLTAFSIPESPGDVALLFGMPRWVFVTVFAPWLVGNVVIVWFALFYMKDTNLDHQES